MEDLIKLLPDNIANQIAAGEVIQRPASVVKELMENAIDAGAARIDVHIKDAGKTLIQVVDNGQGMSPSDALLCFQRHATSKVRTADDLFSLHTKGFRGEALASIAAIAHVEMHTRREHDDVGQNIVIEGSNVQLQEAFACPIGTSFEIKNLFFNVPARRNFLKKDSTEFGHILEEFERIAFAHPDLHLTLLNNGTHVHNLQPAILRKRIINLLGGNLNDKLVPIEENTDIVRVEGYVLKPEHARKTRGDQYFFVNQRFFKSTYFNHAISKAFDGLIKDGSFPGYFLYLHVDTHKIDVNVHPTKTEIKFEEDKYIYSILLSSVRQALGKYNIAPTIEFDRETSFDIPHAMRSQIPQEPVINVNPNFNPFTSATGSSSKGVTKDNLTPAIHKQGFGNAAASTADWENFYSIEEEKIEHEQSELDFEEAFSDQSTFIVKGPYII
ncbi:MAG: DNA mismatch repair protein MutL, partial [Bacteroidetes bacterium RIFCSPHIGHO2_02_FULL_44_7]